MMIQLAPSEINVRLWAGIMIPVVLPLTVCDEVVAKEMFPSLELVNVIGLEKAVVALCNVSTMPGVAALMTSSAFVKV